MNLVDDVLYDYTKRDPRNASALGGNSDFIFSPFVDQSYTTRMANSEMLRWLSSKVNFQEISLFRGT